MVGPNRLLLAAIIAGILAGHPTVEAQSETSKKDGQELFSIDVADLVADFDQSSIVSNPPIIEASFYQMDAPPRVVVPEGCEAYLLVPNNPNNKFRGYKIVGSKPRGKTIQGQFYTLRRHPDQPRETVLAKFEFRVEGNAETRPSAKEFSLARGRFFQHLWSEEHAGSALFRHLATQSLNAAGETAESTGPRWPLRSRSGVDSSIEMLSGGRAVSENLQLDQQLAIPDKDSSELKPIRHVRGVQVRPVDWDDLLQDSNTELDPLAKIIPEDQYAIFVPSFAVFDKLLKRGEKLAEPAVQWFEPQGRKRDALKFYQQQFGLPLDALTRQLGKQLIGEVAITGSDPYFRTGTDIAVLLESRQPELLYQSVSAMIGTTSQGVAGANKITHRIDHHTFDQWTTSNRSLCSIVARIENTVVVSNSMAQLNKILRCSEGNAPNIGNLDEYRFFRQRYPRGEELKSTLVVITDAAIRKWCGPQWRIAASRRTRARASIADVTAQYADQLVHETIDEEISIHDVPGVPKIGSLTVSSTGVHSPTFGTLDFQTPIAEMDLDFATEEEIELYEKWRTQYERKWQRTFDPIALQLSTDGDAIHADLTVIPLIMQSSYRQYTQLVGNVRLKPDAGDPHENALGEISLALDPQSWLMRLAQMIMQQNNPDTDLLAWIDGSITLYFDHDQDWIDRVRKRSPWKLSSDDLVRDIPIGLFIPSRDQVKMTACIIAGRAILNQNTPNIIEWEPQEYQGFQYVEGTWTRGKSNQGARPKVFYVTTNRGLTISPNRTVIERVINRHFDEQPSGHAEDVHSDQVDDDVKETNPQIKFAITGRGWDLMARSNSQIGLRRMNRIAWSNIPILNHLRSKYPGRDPITVYEKLFGEQIQEPSGGKYEWQEQIGTYASTHHGYHLEPKAGPVVSPLLGHDDRIETTVSFENGGLRATLNVQRSVEPQ